MCSSIVHCTFTDGNGFLEGIRSQKQLCADLRRPYFLAAILFNGELVIIKFMFTIVINETIFKRTGMTHLRDETCLCNIPTEYIVVMSLHRIVL